jgi:glutathione S-transferase
MPAVYSFTALVTVAALLLYFYMGFQVGVARGKFGVEAPATSGHPEFERYFRVHMNTLEWLVIFLPCLWMASFFSTDWDAIGAAVITVIGVVWIVGRFIYMRSYVSDPKTRSAGFGIQALATLLLMLISVAGAIGTLIPQ